MYVSVRLFSCLFTAIILTMIPRPPLLPHTVIYITAFEGGEKIYILPRMCICLVCHFLSFYINNKNNYGTSSSAIHLPHKMAFKREEINTNIDKKEKLIVLYINAKVIIAYHQPLHCSTITHYPNKQHSSVKKNNINTHKKGASVSSFYIGDEENNTSLKSLYIVDKEIIQTHYQPSFIPSTLWH